jgi:hypothetical protein
MNNSSYLIARIANMAQWVTSEYFKMKDLPEEFKKLHILNEIFPAYVDGMDNGLTLTEIFKDTSAEETLKRLYKFEEMINNN